MAPARTSTDAGKLIETIEKSQMPLVEEDNWFLQLKAKNSRGEKLSREELEILAKTAEKAREWNKSVERSAMTEREETMAG